MHLSKPEIQQLIKDLAGPRRGKRRPPSMLKRAARYVKQANAEKRVFQPHGVKVLDEVCRLIDEERDADQAWYRVDHLIESGVLSQPPEYRSLQIAVSASIQRVTVAYINLSTGKPATGVLVEIAGRVFLATTAHSIPNKPQGKLSFVGAKADALTDNIARILSFGKDDRRDIGYLELEAALVEKLGKSTLPLSRIAVIGPGQAKHLTIVSGYPAKMVTDVKKDTKVFKAQSWNQTVLEPKDWKALPPWSDTKRKPNPRLDVFIPYLPGEEIVRAYNGKEEKLVMPHGMSGCGYWQSVNPKTKGKRKPLWTADRYRLFAIQSRWWACDRYLQGVQIVHWLRLLWNDRPELRRELKRAFPKVQFTTRKPVGGKSVPASNDRTPAP